METPLITYKLQTNVLTYGGSSDLWGKTWTPAQINDADFGAVLSTNINPFSTNQVDHIQITVTYVVPLFKSIRCVSYANVKSISGVGIAQIKSVIF